ncbi:uncharacterized protein METZ01_LOCUS254317, partial [marine metagenome]
SSPDGAQQLTLLVENEAGTGVVCTATALKDLSRPDAPEITGLPEQSTQEDSIDLTINLRDQHSGIDSLEVFINGSQWANLTSIRAPGANSWSAVLLELEIGGLQDGEYDLEFRLRDHAGNVRTHIEELIIDTTPPLINQFAIELGDIEYDERGVNLTWSAVDDWSQFLKLELLVDGQLWVESLEHTGNYNLRLGTGEYAITLVATDGSGLQTSEELTVRFFVDVAPPTVECHIDESAVEFTPTDGNIYPAVNQIVCNYQDESHIQTPHFEIDNSPHPSTFIRTNTTVNRIIIDFEQSLDSGPHYILLDLEDAKGNTAVFEADIHVSGDELKLSMEQPQTPINAGELRLTLFISGGH